MGRCLHPDAEAGGEATLSQVVGTEMVQQGLEVPIRSPLDLWGV